MVNHLFNYHWYKKSKIDAPIEWNVIPYVHVIVNTFNDNVWVFLLPYFVPLNIQYFMNVLDWHICALEPMEPNHTNQCRQIFLFEIVNIHISWFENSHKRFVAVNFRNLQICFRATWTCNINRFIFWQKLLNYKHVIVSGPYPRGWHVTRV